MNFRYSLRSSPDECSSYECIRIFMPQKVASHDRRINVKFGF